MWQGWETILAYREGTQPDLESALGGARYAVAGPARTLNFGTSACSVGTHTLTTVRHSPVLASGPHGPLDTLQSDGSRTAQAAGLPRYYRPERAVGGFTTSVTPRARAAHAAGLGARYPAGIHESGPGRTAWPVPGRSGRWRAGRPTSASMRSASAPCVRMPA